MEKEKFEVLNGAMAMFDGMVGFKETEYAGGIRYGVILTLRCLGLDQEFRDYLEAKAAETAGAEDQAEGTVPSGDGPRRDGGL